MNFRNLIASGSRIGKRFCATVFAPASSGVEASVSIPATADGVESSVSAATAASKHRMIYKKLSKLPVTGGTVSQTLNQFIMEGITVRKEDLFRCAKDLRKFRRPQHALEVLISFLFLIFSPLLIVDFIICGNTNRKSKALQFHSQKF